MTITEKVRKELWGKSGNKCAICHIDLFHDGYMDSFNFGEECHIISESPKGPRHIDGLEDYNSCDNLILLCRNHHKEIDDPANVGFYSVEKLKQIKENHERWVKQKLSEKRVEEDNLPLIKNGNELLSILGAGIVATYKGNDPITSTEEAEYIGGIWQELTDFIEIASELDPYDITKMEFSFSQMLGEMADKGYFLYGKIKKVRFLKKYGDNTLYNAVILYIKRIEDVQGVL